MGKHIYRAAILVLCIVLYIERYSFGSVDVACLLVGVLASYIDLILEGFVHFTDGKRINSIVKEGLLCVFCVGALLTPRLYYFLPLTGLCSVILNLRVSFVLEIVALGYNFLIDMNSTNLLPIIVFVIAVIGSQFFETNERYSSTIKKERDYSREYEMLLEERNAALIRQQDDMVYTATLQERNRIAREIHDNVGHMLTRSILQLGAIKVINKDERLAAPIDDLAETLNLAMTNIRTSVHDLHDESVDLHSVVEDLANSTEGFDVKLSYDMGDKVPRDIKYAFIAIVKEGINNALKHSNGDTIHITMVEQPAFYQLIISDNGRDIDINYTSGIGLTNIKDRVKQIHGNIRITTDSGFTILVSVMKNK